MKIIILISLLMLSACTGGVAPLIKSAADTSATVSQVTENLLETDVISIEEATQVHQTIDAEIIPRIEAAEAAYAEWRLQAEVYGINNGGDKTAEQYINFANDYLHGLCFQLKLTFCQE